MERIPVTSSNIASIGYDADSQIMHVEFHGGRVYEYSDIDPETHLKLINADSLGGHFSKHIRVVYPGRALDS